MEKIILGSGKIYMMEYTGTTIPEDATIETEGNLAGKVSGGASLEYKPTYYTAKSDDGLVQKTILTDEEVTLKTGVLTKIGDLLTKICSTAKTTSTAGKKTVKIGGVGNQNGKQYLIRFLHEDKVDGDVRITIAGHNESGFTLAFAKDKETIVDAEFKALPHDTEGTLVIYEEEIITAAE